MSTPFAITKDNWQQIDKLEELRLGYSERYNALRGYAKYKRFVWTPAEGETPGTYEWKTSAGIPELQPEEGELPNGGTDDDKLQNNIPSHGLGFNGQSIAFFKEMQEYFDAAEGLTKKEYPYYSYDRQSFFMDAGANLYDQDNHDNVGFRKVQVLVSGEGGVVDGDGVVVPGGVAGDLHMKRGIVAVGDVIGAWLIEDLISVMSVDCYYPMQAGTLTATSIGVITSSWLFDKELEGGGSGGIWLGGIWVPIIPPENALRPGAGSGICSYEPPAPEAGTFEEAWGLAIYPLTEVLGESTIADNVSAGNGWTHYWQMHSEQNEPILQYSSTGIGPAHIVVYEGSKCSWIVNTGLILSKQNRWSGGLMGKGAT